MNKKHYIPVDRVQGLRKNIKSKPYYDVDPHKQRVAQTNMLYLIGLPESIANQKILRNETYCGQYGKISKVLVKQNYINDFQSYSAYVTYQDEQSASIAILGLNNLIFQKNRIYASYGTNKYCSTFIRFGKCRKQDCPFLHQIQKDKQIRQQDNKKLFQQQQESARQYFIQNHENMIFYKFPQAVFPSKYQIRQWMIQQGSIKQKKNQQKLKQSILTTSLRINSITQKTSARSEVSTEGSPAKQLQESKSNEIKIKKRIDMRVRFTKHSAFNFAKQQSTEQYEQVTKQLKEYILQ